LANCTKCQNPYVCQQCKDGLYFNGKHLLI
jgi:hypothetical protein